MSVPGIVQSRLDGEQIAAQVPLGGEDALFVTPTRTLVYREEGLLSDESVEEYSHEAERIEISEGRRKSAIELDYGIDGEERFKVPTNRLYEALHPVLAGVLNAAGVTETEETVLQTYQFSELTLVITSERVVKHVGAAVWDEDYEEYRFEDVTALEVEEGSVSSQIIIRSDDRPQRIKTPSDQTREVRERIEQALLDYYDVGSYDEFVSEHVADPDEDEDEGEDEDADEPVSENDPLAGGVEPIEANPPELDEDGSIVDEATNVVTGGSAGESAEADSRADTGSTGVEAESGGTATGSSDATEPATSGAGTDGDAATDEDVSLVSDATDAGQAGDGDDGFADSVFEPASSNLEADRTEEQLEALTAAVERQNALLAEQQRTLETLIEELRRGR